MGRSGRRIQTFKQFVVHDDACGMKVGTDALLLGSWAGACMESAAEPVSEVLDIGTGSGILALMLAQRFPTATVHAVELEPDAAQQASENAKRSPFRDRITVHHRAFQGWEGRVDLAVCNPPFFHGHPKSQDRKRNLARHDDTLPLTALFKSVKACLNENGEFALVFPEDRANELMAVAQNSGFHLWAKVTLQATEAHEVIRSLWSWRLTPTGKPTYEAWKMEGQEGEGAWSDSVAERLKAFV
jgi:tRNA1Val (adenine37-N6)-methyltransferase